jgi:hypothetical protein
LEVLLAAPLAPQTTQEAQLTIADRQAMKKRGLFAIFAHISPLTPGHASGSDSDAGNTAWIGPRGFVDDLVCISRRLSADNEWPWSDEEQDHEEDIDSSDDDWWPKASWPVPQNVGAHELFGDEGEILKGRVTIMTRPPLGSEDDLYNKDEKMVFQA